MKNTAPTIKSKKGKRNLRETLPIRIDTETQETLDRITEATGLNRSAVVRMSLRHGLPLVESGKLAVRTA